MLQVVYWALTAVVLGWGAMHYYMALHLKPRAMLADVWWTLDRVYLSYFVVEFVDRIITGVSPRFEFRGLPYSRAPALAPSRTPESRAPALAPSRTSSLPYSLPPILQ